jgi:hypothetical protein
MEIRLVEKLIMKLRTVLRAKIHGETVHAETIALNPHT